MYRTIKRIYENTGNAEIVLNACEKGWITESQCTEILGE